MCVVYAELCIPSLRGEESNMEMKTVASGRPVSRDLKGVLRPVAMNPGRL